VVEAVIVYVLNVVVEVIVDVDYVDVIVVAALHKTKQYHF